MSVATFISRQWRKAWPAPKAERQWRNYVAAHRLNAADCCLIANYGIGDHFLVCALAEAVQTIHGCGVLVAGNPRYRFLARLFPAVREYVDWPPGLDGALFANPRKISAGTYYYSHFPSLELYRAVGYGDFHFVDAYRCRLQLPPGTKLTVPLLPTQPEIETAAAWLRSQGCDPAKTVLLATDANTTPTDGVDQRFWTELAAQLARDGAQPVVNAGPNTRVPIGLKGLSLPLDRFRAVTLAAAGLIAVRSGLADLACDLPCPKFIVYPDVRLEAGSIYGGTRFDRYGLPNPPAEVVLSEGRRDLVIAQIARYFCQPRH